MTTPPAQVAAVNRHPIRIARIRPSSSTRLVEANWNAIAALKSPPLTTIERAIAAAA
jgi:hypothetical protein